MKNRGEMLSSLEFLLIAYQRGYLDGAQLLPSAAASYQSPRASRTYTSGYDDGYADYGCYESYNQRTTAESALKLARGE